MGWNSCSINISFQGSVSVCFCGNVLSSQEKGESWFSLCCLLTHSSHRNTELFPAGCFNRLSHSNGTGVILRYAVGAGVDAPGSWRPSLFEITAGPVKCGKRMCRFLLTGRRPPGFPQLLRGALGPGKVRSHFTGPW